MDLRVDSAGKNQLAGMVRDVCRIRPFDSDINDLPAVNAKVAISMDVASADNISMKRQIHIALAQLSALARITPKTGPNAKQLAFGCIEKKSQIDYSYIEKPICVFGDGEKFRPPRVFAQLLPVDCGIDSSGTAQPVSALRQSFRRAHAARWPAASGWEIRDLRKWTNCVSALSLDCCANWDALPFRAIRWAWGSVWDQGDGSGGVSGLVVGR